jgi:AcrR family transcriptional regulator
MLGSAGMPRPKRQWMENDARRAQLVAHALGAFSGSSYDEVSMEEVAKAAGISKGLVYHYFPTKRHVYVAALREAARQLLAETAPSESEAEGDAKLRRGLEAYLSFVEKHARAYTALLRGGVGVDDQVNAIVEGTRAKFVDRFLSPSGATPALRLQLRGWIGFVEATALAWLEDRPVTRPVLVDTWMTALLVLTQSMPSHLPRA